MGMFDNIRSKIVNFVGGILNDAYSQRVDYIMDRREYRLGMQKAYLKPSRDGFDDNLIVNFCSLVVDRSISMLFGQGIEFEYGEDEDTQAFIDDIYRSNKRSIFLHKVALYGSESGECFVKIVPKDGGVFVLKALDPSLVDIKTDPDDYETVIRYIVQYKSQDEQGREIAKREVTERSASGWTVTNYTSSQVDGAKWIMDGAPILWNYAFPPILEWQNLPTAGEVWGMSDITADVIRLQNRINFIASNISKIIRLYAHPQRWSRFFGRRKANNQDEQSMGPEDMPNSENEKAEIQQLSPAGDLMSSQTFLLWLRQALFDITRTVDISSITDKIGALTNFGLHVLYQDMLAKNNTKRELYGDALNELNKRLLSLAGKEPVDCEIVWPEPLPENATEETAALQADMNMGIVDKQTVSELRGYDWELVQERLAQEQQKSDTIGSALLRAFDQGRGGPPNMDAGQRQLANMPNQGEQDQM